MLIEKENWDISSGIGGHQCMLDPGVLSAESVEPCKVGLCLVILSRFMRPGQCAALPRAGVLKMVPGHGGKQPRLHEGAPASVGEEGLEEPCFWRAARRRAPGGKGRRALDLLICVWNKAATQNEGSSVAPRG